MAKHPIVDVWQGSEYASVSDFLIYKDFGYAGNTQGYRLNILTRFQITLFN